MTDIQKWIQESEKLDKVANDVVEESFAPMQEESADDATADESPVTQPDATPPEPSTDEPPPESADIQQPDETPPEVAREPEAEAPIEAVDSESRVAEPDPEPEPVREPEAPQEPTPEAPELPAEPPTAVAASTPSEPDAEATLPQEPTPPAEPDHPVGDQGTFDLPEATIDEYRSGKFEDDVPDQSDVDRQVSERMQLESQRGDDLATKLHDQLKPMFDGIANMQSQLVADTIDVETMTLALMRE